MRISLIITLFIPFVSFTQSGISLSGSSQFSTGQNLYPIGNNTFDAIDVESRNYKLSLSIFRGRKFKIGTFAVNTTLSYNIKNEKYIPHNALSDNYNSIQNSFIPQIEIWYFLFQNQNIFIYTSIGSYAIMQDLTLSQKESNNEVVSNYNQLTPFVRGGLQLNYGRLFINPYISFDLDEMYFDSFSDFRNYNLNKQLKNYTIRSGLEFGIMF
ncbi:hypothetical protein OAJ42_01245 [Flavobacteriales bacterium]|nr:hypothetical protein [Flavobacteriales bacterium]